MSERLCLRCKTVALVPVESDAEGIAFFECPACHRQYALKPGKGLTFRWLHPISLPLYSVLFERSPAGRAADVAASLVRDRPAEDLAVIVREIRLELDDPTQEVRDILDSPTPEAELRAFLRLVVEGIEKSLAPQRPQIPTDGG
jgi:hypothetical protein